LSRGFPEVGLAAAAFIEPSRQKRGLYAACPRCTGRKCSARGSRNGVPARIGKMIPPTEPGNAGGGGGGGAGWGGGMGGGGSVAVVGCGGGCGAGGGVGGGGWGCGGGWFVRVVGLNNRPYRVMRISRVRISPNHRRHCPVIAAVFFRVLVEGGSHHACSDGWPSGFAVKKCGIYVRGRE